MVAEHCRNMMRLTMLLEEGRQVNEMFRQEGARRLKAQAKVPENVRRELDRIMGAGANGDSSKA